MRFSCLIPGLAAFVLLIVSACQPLERPFQPTIKSGTRIAPGPRASLYIAPVQNGPEELSQALAKKLQDLGIAAFTGDKPPVLLIDEIDKADIEFPNDLLLELDKMEFFVYETKEVIKAKTRPIIIITSNNEKELPDAFLRRCFFHYIEFPDTQTMEKIVDVHYPGIKKELVRQAMDIFFDVRKVPGLKKKPSTSELIDWLKLLMADDLPEDILKNHDSKNAIPPLYGALLKNEQDVHLLEKLAFMHRANR